jgi:nucleoid-associated protein YgaU
LFVGYLFIVNKTKLASQMSIEKSAQFEIIEDILPQRAPSVEKRVESGLSQEQMAQVVRRVISKINQDRENEIVGDELYTKELLTQDVDELVDNSNNVDLKEVNREEIITQNIALKDIDHYNKVIINKPKDEKYTNDRLTKLSSELSFVIDASSDVDSSNYTDKIIKEIAVRSNEMRIIIVKKGDTLSKIAKRAYDNYDAYIKIFEANPEVIKNPNQIFVGQRLRIPL